MTDPDPLGPAATIAALSSTTHPLGELTTLPPTSGLYAWWATPETLPHLPGPTHPHHNDLRLLYIEIASNLRRRIISNHLRRSGSSTLRRTLAGLLLAEHGYRTERIDPAAVEPTVIARWAPPLNLDHATDAIRDIVTAARAAYNSST